MTDLFGHTPRQRAKVGVGNGTFLGHRANGMSPAQLRKNLADGLYPDLHPAYLAEAFPTQMHPVKEEV